MAKTVDVLEGTPTTVRLEEISPFSINVRFENNLKLGVMKDQMEQRMKQGLHPIAERVHLLKVPKGFNRTDDSGYKFGTGQERPYFPDWNDKLTEKYIVLRGNRRRGGTLSIINDARRLEEEGIFTRDEIRQCLEIPAEIYEFPVESVADWNKVLDFVRDHATHEGLSKSEVVRTIYEKMDYGQDLNDIFVEMYSLLNKVKLLNNTEAAQKEILSKPKPSDRHKAILKKCNNLKLYYGRTDFMGPAIREQVILNFKNSDGLMTEDEHDELILFDTKYQNVVDTLLPGLTEDLGEDAKGPGLEERLGKPNLHSPITSIKYKPDTREVVIEGGGPNLREAVTKLVIAYQTGEKVEKPKVMSSKNLDELITSVRKSSPRLGSLLSIVRGKTEDAKFGKAEVITWAAYWERVEEILRENADSLPPAVKEFVNVLLSDNLGKFKEYIESVQVKETVSK